MRRTPTRPARRRPGRPAPPARRLGSPLVGAGRSASGWISRVPLPHRPASGAADTSPERSLTAVDMCPWMVTRLQANADTSSYPEERGARVEPPYCHEWRERSSRMTAVAPTRVITADDDPFARRVIKAALQAAGLTVIAEAKNGREAVQLALHYRPDVVVMDVVMPELDGILATRQILKTRPDQLIVVLTGDDEHEFGLPALKAGAVGFLSKDADIEALPRALQGVLRGEAAISREMTRRLIDRYRGTADGAEGLRPIRSPLTPREWEVIELLQPDRSPDDVADTLVLSTETVRTHIKNIMRKLNVHSRADAISAAERLRT